MATQYFQAVQQPAAGETAGKRHLFGPATDFLCLGGGSLIILPLLMLLPVETYKAEVALAALLIAHLVNHPHFAHSYQIFYRDYRAKAFSRSLGGTLQARYLLSGLIVPALLILFFAYCLIAGAVQLLGYSANLMALLVGWHYVKQGYGMLMVDAVLKRQFFTASQKKILLANSYAVWIAAWCKFNELASQKALWGLEYYSFDLPDMIVTTAGGIALASSIVMTCMLYSRWRSTGSLPVNGVVAYLVSLYVWLLFIGINPLWALIVPAFHSLQYLAVVWRFEMNRGHERVSKEEDKIGYLEQTLFGTGVKTYMMLFSLTGILIGLLGFWGIPIVLDSYVSYDSKIFGSTLFLFVAWIFINVHHYFLDNVMWRRENPDMRRYLFN